MAASEQLARLSPRALAFTVFTSVFGGFLLTVGGFYVQAVGQQEAALRRHVRDQALLLAGMVDVERHERLTNPQMAGGEDYQAVLAPLLHFHRQHPHIQYVWTVRVGAEDRQTFVLETSVDPEIRRVQEAMGRSQDVIPFLGPNTAETPEGATSLPELRAGQAIVFPVPYSDEHGTYIEARAPLRDTHGNFFGYLGLDYGLGSFEEQVNEVRLAGLGALALALVLALLLARTAYRMRQARDEMRREIEQERDKADRANAAKSELLAIATHDLKNPLSAIAGMSGLLLKQKKQSDPAAAGEEIEVLETIHASTQHMAEIVRGILLNEGIEFGGVEFHPAPTDLVQVCRDILRFNTPAATRKRIIFKLELPESLTVPADIKLLREAFDNYLSNAIKYSPPGRTVTVSLVRSPGEQWVEFSVRDEGSGLSAGDQAMLFQKFKKLTPRPTAGESSTGLGLSIVKTVAERHGGSVGCESSPGQGARFWLRLPGRSPG